MRTDSTFIIAVVLIAFVIIFNFGIFIWSGAYKYAKMQTKKQKEREIKNKDKKY